MKIIQNIFLYLKEAENETEEQEVLQNVQLRRKRIHFKGLLCKLKDRSGISTK